MATHDYLPAPNEPPAFWTKDRDEFYSHRTTPDLPQTADVLIIGAGYAGTSVAWHLLRGHGGSPVKERTIVMLEARGICSGATGRNGGHVRPDLYSEMPVYVSRHGLDAARELAEFELSHITALRQLVEAESIGCDFEIVQHTDVWANQSAADRVKHFYDTMIEKDVRYMQNVHFQYGPQEEMEHISGVKGAKATATYEVARIWAYKLVKSLLESLVASNDINIQTSTPVLKVVPMAKGFSVVTARGSITVSKVVYANNAYVGGLLPQYARSIVPCKGVCSRVVAVAPDLAPYVANNYIERDHKQVLSYLVPRPDGSIIVGGASKVFHPNLPEWYNNVDDTEVPPSTKTFYDNYMQQTFTDWKSTKTKVDQQWSGVMGYSFDSLPHVGVVPDGPSGQFIIAGFNGHGMPVAWLAGKGLAKMIHEGCAFEESNLPRLLKTTRARIDRARSTDEQRGDIIGDGSLGAII